MRRTRIAGLRLRWLGMALVALAILLGTPVAVSMLPRVTIAHMITERPAIKYDTTRYYFVLDKGAFGFKVWVESTPGIYGWFHADDPRNAWSVDWTFNEHAKTLIVPAWPFPLVLGAIGVLVWRTGQRRLGLTRTAVALLHVRGGWKHATKRWGFVCLALATGAIMVASFANKYTTARPVYSMRDSQRSGYTVGVMRGAFVWSNDFLLGTVFVSPRPGPLRWVFDRANGETLIMFPFWPLPLALLTIGGVMTYRRERRIIWAAGNRCARCGYSRVGLNNAPCPECGASAS